jgi:hypothetical protein
MKLIEEIINKGKFVFRKSTPKKMVNDLIKKLHPHQTEHELIRYGNQGDGGYLIPNDLVGIKACFSPGVHMVSEFEFDCLKVGMKVYMADKSVEKPNLNIPETDYNFIQKFVGCTNNLDFITMDSWVESSKLSSESELILQMDIEGSEYNSLINMTDDLLMKFRIIVIEFHSLQDLWQPRFFDIASIAFNKLLQTYTCVHIHPNNEDGIDTRLGIEIPKTAEFTFLRNDRIVSKKATVNFPHKLDFDNSDKKHISLPNNWYK